MICVASYFLLCFCIKDIDVSISVSWCNKFAVKRTFDYRNCMIMLLFNDLLLRKVVSIKDVKEAFLVTNPEFISSNTISQACCIVTLNFNFLDQLEGFTINYPNRIIILKDIEALSIGGRRNCNWSSSCLNLIFELVNMRFWSDSKASLDNTIWSTRKHNISRRS